jgi:hypothetical protein
MSTKLAITINLKDLEQLMKQYVAEELASDRYLLEQMRLGHFLLWLTKRQESMVIYCNVCRQVHANKADNCPSMAGLA